MMIERYYYGISLMNAVLYGCHVYASFLVKPEFLTQMLLTTFIFSSVLCFSSTHPTLTLEREGDGAEIVIDWGIIN